MKFEYILAIIGAAVSLLSTLLGVFFSRKSSKQAKVVALAKVVQQIPAAVSEAEKLFTASGSGAAKLSYVLGKLELACVRTGVDYESNAEGLKGEVEAVLSTPQKKN